MIATGIALTLLACAVSILCWMVWQNNKLMRAGITQMQQLAFEVDEAKEGLFEERESLRAITAEMEDELYDELDEYEDE